MKSKKLSLGEILRKINEEKQTTGPDSSAPPSSSEPMVTPEPVPENPAPAEPLPRPRSLYAGPRPSEEAVSPANTGKKEHRTPLTHDQGRPVLQPDAAIHHQHSAAGHQSAMQHQPKQMPHQPNPEEDEVVEFDLFKYFGIIIHRKNIVLLATCLVTVFSIFHYIKGEKIFTSHARLLFKPAEKEMTGELVSSSIINRDKLFNTHLELLKSNTVLIMVADNLGARVQPEQIRVDLTIAQGMTNRDKNDIIEIGYKNRDPELARDVINEICKTYIDYRLEVNSQEVTRLLYKLDLQVKKLQKELDQKESDLRRFKESNRMVELSSEANLTSTKLSNMEIALQETQLALIGNKDKLTSLTSQIGKQDLTIVQSMTYSDPVKEKLSALELEYNSLSAENSPEHPKVRMIRQQIEKLKAAIVDSISQEAASKTLIKNPLRQSLLSDYVNLTIEQSALEAKRIALEKVIENLNLDLLKLPAIEQKYAFLQRETEAILQTLRLLKTKYEEAKIKRDSQETDIKILELAELPRAATSTVKPISILLGLLIGLILGIAFAFLLEYLDQSVKDPLQIEKILGMPLLGVVPLIETSDAIIKKSDDFKKTILEPFRTLRANIKHLAATYNHKVFMICSAIKGEGKTTLAANLAITFALDGKKVIIIDADLRRSQLHNLFSIPKENGLADYLLEARSISDILKPTVFENLHIITSGERPHNPAELIGTMRFDVLIRELRKLADIVFFDSPALLPVSDGLSMAPKMDGCIMAFRTMWTPLKAAKQAKEQISRVGAHIMGGIFNGVAQGRGYYPYYYGYYGYYSYSKYSYDDEPQRKFSWRELGLLIEGSIKNGSRSFRNSLPHYFASCGAIIKTLAGKRSFWVLLILFLGLTGAELWLNLRPAPEMKDEEGITYLGVGSGSGATVPLPEPQSAMPMAQSTPQTGLQISPKDSVTPGSSSIDSNTAMIQKKPAAAIDSLQSPQEKKVDGKPAADTSTDIPKTTLSATGLRDSILQWFAAKKQGNINNLLRFYDSVDFKGPGKENFFDLRANALKSVVKDTSAIVIDSIWRAGHKWPFIMTKTRFRTVNGVDTARVIVGMLWKNGADGWRIVGEKR